MKNTETRVQLELLISKMSTEDLLAQRLDQAEAKRDSLVACVETWTIANNIIEKELKLRGIKPIRKTKEDATILSVRQVRRILFETDQYAVIGEDEMTNEDARWYLYQIKEQDKTFVNVIDNGDYLSIFNI